MPIDFMILNQLHLQIYWGSNWESLQWCQATILQFSLLISLVVMTRLSIFFKIHFLKPFSSFGGGLPPAAVPPPLGSNALTKTPIAIPITVSMEAIVILCSRKSVQIFSDNEVSLFKTLTIVSLKLVIWSFSLPLRRSMQVVIQLDGSFSNVFPNPIIVFWIVSDFLKLMLFFLDSSFQLNLFCHFHLYQTPNTLLVLVPKQILLLQG